MINEDMSKYQNWFDGNKLVINMLKSNYMCFKPRKKDDLNLEICSIKKVHETKYIEVIIDDKISWEEHISSIKRKVTPII